MTALANLKADPAITAVFVVSIEGYENLLYMGKSAAGVVTDATVLAAYTADDYGYTGAIPGLDINWSGLKQELHPYDTSFRPTSLSFSVNPGRDDRFGSVVFKRKPDISSYLSTDIDEDDLTVSVLTNAAYPASGTIYIGTEAISYSSKPNATDFTVATNGRGIYSPFKADTETLKRFGRAHRLQFVADEVNFRPRVTTEPVVWNGRQIAVRLHTFKEGALDSADNSLLVFGGTIDNVREASNGFTTCSCSDFRKVLGETVIGHDQLIGKAAEGLFFREGWVAGMAWFTGTTTDAMTAAERLDVVAGAPAGAKGIKEGTYTIEEVLGVLNKWVGAAAYGREYMVTLATHTPGAQRTRGKG